MAKRNGNTHLVRLRLGAGLLGRRQRPPRRRLRALLLDEAGRIAAPRQIVVLRHRRRNEAHVRLLAGVDDVLAGRRAGRLLGGCCGRIGGIVLAEELRLGGRRRRHGLLQRGGPVGRRDATVAGILRAEELL